jgi:hypothetical protein
MVGKNARHRWQVADALVHCARKRTGSVLERVTRTHRFVFVSALNLTPNRIATLRMRSGVRSMIRAASSNDVFALASSITRRLCANDQDLRATVVRSWRDQTRQPKCSLTDRRLGKMAGAQPITDRSNFATRIAY